MYDKGWRAFRKADYAAALTCFKAHTEASPDDPCAQRLLRLATRYHVAPQRYHRTVGVPWACVEDATTAGPDTLGVQSYHGDSPRLELRPDTAATAFGKRLESTGSSTSLTLPPDSHTAASVPTHTHPPSLSRLAEERVYFTRSLRSVSPLQEPPNRSASFPLTPPR